MNAENENMTERSSLTPELERFCDRLDKAKGDESTYAFAKRTGFNESLIRKYLSGASMPLIDRAAELAIALKVDLNWLATGTGEMRPTNTKMSPSSNNQERLPLKLDRQKIVLAIETVEEGLQITGRVMKPNKKAELVMAVYDLLAEQSEQQPQIKKETLLRLVKSAA